MAKFKETMSKFGTYFVEEARHDKNNNMKYTPATAKQMYRNFKSVLLQQDRFAAYTEPSWFSDISTSVETRMREETHDSGRVNLGPKDDRKKNVTRDILGDCILQLLLQSTQDKGWSTWGIV